MSEIRPDLPIPQPLASGPSAQIRAAQAAFFRAALAETAPSASTASDTVAQPSSTNAQETPRLPRPGALLDIRV